RPHPAGRALTALLACAAEGLSARRFAEYLSLAQVPGREKAIGQSDEQATDQTLWEPPDSEFILDSSSLEDEVDAKDETGVDENPTGSFPDGTPAGSVRAPWRWERLLVDSAVIGGKDRWKRRLDGLETELRLKRQSLCDEEEETRAVLVDQQLKQLA